MKQVIEWVRINRMRKQWWIFLNIWLTPRRMLRTKDCDFSGRYFSIFLYNFDQFFFVALWWLWNLFVTHCWIFRIWFYRWSYQWGCCWGIQKGFEFFINKVPPSLKSCYIGVLICLILSKLIVMLLFKIFR